MQRMISARVSSLLFSVLFVCAMTGCNTVSGVGEDLEAAGSAIEDTAKEEQTY